MTSPFPVSTTPRFDRMARKLQRQHPEFADRLTQVIHILSVDPHNHPTNHPIKKLEGIAQGEGQYRLRLGHWRFCYDIYGDRVVLHYCGLRREETYRQ